MNTVDRKYLDLIEDITVDGKNVQSRNSLTRKVFHRTLTFDSTPLISVRRTAWRNCLKEFEWFLSGSSNIKDLDKSVRHWWEPWATKSNNRPFMEGHILNNYSRQFRHSPGTSQDYDDYPEIDQIEYLINELKNKPQSRRQVITTWNTCDMASEDTPITNCHGSIIQTDVDPETKELTLFMYQRSCDVMLGLPHNILQYYAFLLYLSHQANLVPGKLIITLGNAHIYESHFSAAEECRNTPISQIETPTLTYNPTSDNFKADDFSLDGEYKPLIKKSLELIV